MLPDTDNTARPDEMRELAVHVLWVAEPGYGLLNGRGAHTDVRVGNQYQYPTKVVGSD